MIWLIAWLLLVMGFIVIAAYYSIAKEHKKLDFRSKERAESRFGSCGICGDSWRWKERHYLPMPDASAIFPYCEECHKTKSKKEKHEAIDKLKQKWGNTMPFMQEDLEKIEEAHRIVEAEG